MYYNPRVTLDGICLHLKNNPNSENQNNLVYLCFFFSKVTLILKILKCTYIFLYCPVGEKAKLNTDEE